MEKLINVYKKIGKTPFQLIQDFKAQFKLYKNIPISHAGKLDPLAEGVMFLVAGNEIKNIKKYMGQDKEYKAKILFGFSTDSYDIQGLATKKNPKIDLESLKEIITDLKGEYVQTLPIYSGRIVNGKPLFYYARKNKLDKITIPKEKVTLYKVKLESIEKITSKALLNEINKKINLLIGDFRQKEIIESWTKILKDIDEEYIIANITVSCSSGTYIRSIANDIGERLGSGGILLNLVRTKVGRFNMKDSIRLKV